MQYSYDHLYRIINDIYITLNRRYYLIQENKILEKEKFLLKIKINMLSSIIDNNIQLKKLLSISAIQNHKIMISKVLYTNANITDFRRFIILDKGKKDNVYIGQLVINENGIIGKVIQIGSCTSIVLLISDPKSIIAVKNNRTGEQFILSGTKNENILILQNVPNTCSIHVGDLLLLSELEEYPYLIDYPVGYVKNIYNIFGKTFFRVNVTPISNLKKNSFVLLIWPSRKDIIFSMQIKKQIEFLKECL